MSEIELKVTCSAAPTQIEGKGYGKFIYFRERGGHWQFGYGDTIEEAVYGNVVARGECPEFMSVKNAKKLASAFIDVFIKPE